MTVVSLTKPLMSSETTFLLENATWPVLLADAAGAVSQANAASRTLLGNVTKLNEIWLPENTSSAADFLKQTGKPAGRQGVFKLKTAAGTAEFSAGALPVEDDGEKLFLLQLLPSAAAGMGSGSDAALKQKLDCALQLARTVSLDFNNALAGVLGNTSLLLGKAEPGHPWRKALIEVEKSVSRAAEIASELALFSRQEKETRRTPPGNLNLVVNRCAEFFQNAQGKRFSWKLGLERSLFAARFDEAKVQQAVTKILENAVESYGTSGTGQITVKTQNVELAEPTQDRNVKLAPGIYVCIEITDNGPGIEPEALPRIFEPFFTTKRPPHRGLGLALVYGIITNHGGGVAISSRPGEGTSARIYLPADKSVIPNSGGENDLRGAGTILVVDDEALVLTMMETILTEFGYRVLTASSGQKALAVLAQPDSKVNLLITDLVMPGMGGRELIERVRQTHPALPVICASGYVSSEDANSGGGYLQKPFTSGELLSRVKQALESVSAA